MSDIRLSQDAEYLLCELYTAYRIRRKNGMTSDKAKLFGGSKAIQTEFIQQWPTNDIDESARELHRCGMLLCGYGDNSIRNCVLLSDGIVYMEHHFGDKLDQLIQRIAALRAAIFG